MKALNLNKICEILNLPTTDNEIKIKHVTYNMNEMYNDTLVFHLDKVQEINIEKFKQLENCFIITDQPLLITDSDLKPYVLHCLDIERAFYQFIDYYRGLFHFPVVAITGTCGKTTTKEMIKQVLEKNYKVASTILSKNSIRFNLKYLMSIDDDTSYGVFETGLTDPGNLVNSCEYFKPDIGVITNIGIDHLSGCKTLDNYIRAKGEMLAGLHYKGTLIINGDDEQIKKIDLSIFKGDILTFGLSATNDMYATKIKQRKRGMLFEVIHKDQTYKAYVPGIGEHNVYNALAAYAVLYTLGFGVEESIGLLSSFKHVQSHLEIHNGRYDTMIIDDTWSSNPTSMKAAFKAIRSIERTKVVVLGRISYLGDSEDEQCELMGKMVVDYGIDYLICKDDFSKKIGMGAIKYGMDQERVFICNNDEEVKILLSNLLNPDTLVLFKVSMFDKSMKTLMHFCIES